MTSARLVWVAGSALAVIALLLAILTASALPLGYDSKAYWLAARHLVDGTPVFPAPDATLGAAQRPAGSGTRSLRRASHRARGRRACRRRDAALPLTIALFVWLWLAAPLLPAILLPFYLAAGRVSIALRAVVIGIIGLLVTLPFVWQPMLDYVALIPRYAETAWVRVIVQRDEPAFLATIFWSDAFPLILALLAISLTIFAGRMARRDPENETAWHHVALALSPYLSPFGFIWTTFLITTLPLFAVALARAWTLRGATRIVALVGIALCWLLMQIVQLHDLLPILWHLVGVLGLVAISLALLGRSARPAERERRVLGAGAQPRQRA